MEFLIQVKEDDGSRSVVKSLTLEKLDGVNGFMVQEPSFRLERDEAQVLMDDLWQCGMRPTEGTGSAGSLKAVERHLEDMRTLVFKPNKS